MSAGKDAAQKIQEGTQDRFKQIDKGLGDVPYLGPVNDTLKQLQDDWDSKNT